MKEFGIHEACLAGVGDGGGDWITRAVGLWVRVWDAGGFDRGWCASKEVGGIWTVRLG